jgi:hypothetical protein
MSDDPPDASVPTHAVARAGQEIGFTGQAINDALLALWRKRAAATAQNATNRVDWRRPERDGRTRQEQRHWQAAHPSPWRRGSVGVAACVSAVGRTITESRSAG